MGLIEDNAEVTMLAKKVKRSLEKQRGGSLASDNVMNEVSPGFDKLIGGSSKIKYKLFHGYGGNPPISLPAANLAQIPNNMSASMVHAYAQPLTPNIPSSSAMIFPSYYANFNPLLTNGGKKKKTKK